jgi:hypothetical protein
MKYDDASWHLEGEFPEDLPNEAAATHIGMFLTWALLSGLGGPHFVSEFPEELAQLQARAVTPGQFLLASCDGSLIGEDLSLEGNAFTRDYFYAKTKQYLADYTGTLGGTLPSLYHAADTWENFDRLKPVLGQRLAEWRNRAE